MKKETRAVAHACLARLGVSRDRTRNYVIPDHRIVATSVGRKIPGGSRVTCRPSTIRVGVSSHLVLFTSESKSKLQDIWEL